MIIRDLMLHKYQTAKLEVEVYPNPFCYNTFIMFEMENEAEVRVIIYDVQGNAVNELMNANVPAGNYNLTWSGEDEGGNRAENGTYLVSVFVDGHEACSDKVVKKGR